MRCLDDDASHENEDSGADSDYAGGDGDSDDGDDCDHGDRVHDAGGDNELASMTI